jgi:hypothetical protein
MFPFHGVSASPIKGPNPGPLFFPFGIATVEWSAAGQLPTLHIAAQFSGKPPFALK